MLRMKAIKGIVPLFLVILMVGFVSAQKTGGGGFEIESDKDTYYCSEYISMDMCLVKATITIRNFNNEKYSIENIADYTTNVTETKFKHKHGELIPSQKVPKKNKQAKGGGFKTDKIDIDKNSMLTLDLEFPISSSGKFNYTIAVYDKQSNVNYYNVTLDPYYEYFYQSSDGSKEADILIENYSLNNLYALKIKFPAPLNQNESFNYSFCVFGEKYEGNLSMYPFVAWDTNDDYHMESITYDDTAISLSNFYDWNCWNLTYINYEGFDIANNSNAFFGFLCSGCSLNTSQQLFPAWTGYQYNTNEFKFSIFNNLEQDILWFNFTTITKRNGMTLDQCNGGAGVTSTDLSNSTHFICNYVGTKTIKKGGVLTVKTKTNENGVQTEPQVIWYGLTPIIYDNGSKSIHIGLDTNGVPQNLSYRYNITPLAFQPLPDNLMMALDLGVLNPSLPPTCDYSKIELLHTNCTPEYYWNVTYNVTLTNCSSYLVVEPEWCQYQAQCEYSKVEYSVDDCTTTDLRNVTYNITETNCSWHLTTEQEYCDYCEPDWDVWYINSSWQCMETSNGTMEYHTYFDYNFCYEDTGLYTDSCDYYYSDCNRYVPCSLYQQDFQCQFNEHPYIEGQTTFLCEVPEATQNCYSYIRKGDNILQTNPEDQIRNKFTGLAILEKPLDDQLYFQANAGLVKPYITNKNLYPDNQYVMGVKCTVQNGNNSEVLTWEQPIEPEYKPFTWTLYRGLWLKENLGVIIGTVVVGFLIIVIGLYLWRRAKAR